MFWKKTIIGNGIIETNTQTHPEMAVLWVSKDLDQMNPSTIVTDTYYSTR